MHPCGFSEFLNLFGSVFQRRLSLGFLLRMQWLFASPPFPGVRSSFGLGSAVWSSLQNWFMSYRVIGGLVSRLCSYMLMIGGLSEWFYSF